MARIRVGIGGWTYEPWRGSFYPAGLPQARELGHASRALTSIEINGTFYGNQKPESFRRWRDETPDDFVFSVKGPRAATHRRDFATDPDSIERFLGSGVTELGPKLGPILWQFPPTRQRDAGQLEGFLALLPCERDGLRLRHVVELRHPSWQEAETVASLRRAGAALAIVDSEKQFLAGDLTADFVYLRLQRTEAAEETGYPAAALDRWTARARDWCRGAPVDDLPAIAPEEAAAPAPRDVFLYFIAGAKERAPFAAMATIARLG